MPPAIARDRSKNPPYYIRELVQNALDACMDKKAGDCCDVNFRLTSMRSKCIPGFKDYKKALKLAFDSSSKEGYGNKDYLKKLQENSNKSTATVMLVTDNGSGFTEKSMRAVLRNGCPDKPHGASGSFGLGHLTTFTLSGLQYLLYLGKSKQQTLFAGAAKIASHQDERGKLFSPNGYLSKTAKGGKAIFYNEKELPSVLQEEYEKISETGSIVAILDFNWFSESGSESEHHSKEEVLKNVICDAVIANFAIAIASKKLTVTLLDELTITSKNLSKIAEERVKNNPGDRTIRIALENIQTFHKPRVSNSLAGEFADCTISLRDLPSEHGVSFWRNGMLITRKQSGFAQRVFADEQTFDAVVLLNGNQDKPTSHDLVRSAENSTHDQIDYKSNDLSSDKRKKLRALMKQIRNWLKEHACKLDTEIFDLNDLLINKPKQSIGFTPIPENSTRSGRTNFGLPNDVPATTTTETSDPNPDPKPRNIKEPKYKAKPANFRQQGLVLNDQTWEICLQAIGNYANVIMRLLVDTGQDPSCKNNLLGKPAEIAEITIDKKSLSLPLEDDCLVPLGEVTEGQELKITVKFLHKILAQGGLQLSLATRFYLK